MRYKTLENTIKRIIIERNLTDYEKKGVEKDKAYRERRDPTFGGMLKAPDSEKEAYQKHVSAGTAVDIDKDTPKHDNEAWRREVQKRSEQIRKEKLGIGNNQTPNQIRPQKRNLAGGIAKFVGFKAIRGVELATNAAGVLGRHALGYPQRSIGNGPFSGLKGMAHDLTKRRGGLFALGRDLIDSKKTQDYYEKHSGEDDDNGKMGRSGLLRRIRVARLGGRSRLGGMKMPSVKAAAARPRLGRFR